MSVYDIVVGTTGVLDFQLLEVGAPINLASFTVTLLLEDRAGTTVSSPGTVTVTDATNGKVRFTPTNSTVFDGSKGPYQARWKITDTNGLASFIPTSERDLWNLIGQ